MGTSKNRFEKGKWVECAECDESRRSKAVCLTRRFEEAVGVLYTFSLKQGFLEVTLYKWRVFVLFCRL